MHIEHVNLTVSDLEQSIRFYRELLGFEVRWRGTLSDGQPAAHVGDLTGDRQCYLALFQASQPGRASEDYGRAGLNHVGFVVDDLDAMRVRLAALGVEPHLEGDYEPGRRLYFHDPSGVEVELVEYGAAS